MQKLLKPAFVLTLCLLALAEIGARVFFSQNISGRFSYGYDLQAGFIEHGNGTVELVRAGGRRFFPQAFAKRRPRGVFRIFVVGDSVPRGPSLKEAYAWCLVKEMEKHQIRAESINLAVPGFGARRCQLILHKIMAFEPSLVILHVNNSNEYEDEREYRRSQEFKGWHPRHWPMKIFIFRRLYEAKMEKVFWWLVPEQIRQGYARNDVGAQVAASKNPQMVKEWQRRVAEVTAADVVLALRSQVPLLLITQCRLNSRPDHAPGLDDNGLDALGQALAGPGVYHLSMKEILSGVPDIQTYFEDTGHLKKSGHLLMAQAIFRKIEQEQVNLGLAALRIATEP